MKRYPKLIAEVLSLSSAESDRRDKFQDYMNLESLEEYILIVRDKMQVECRRVRGISVRDWETTIYGAGDRVLLKRIGLDIEMKELYRGVNRELEPVISISICHSDG